jgi:glycolate oxidase FAD binding subunit
VERFQYRESNDKPAQKGEVNPAMNGALQPNDENEVAAMVADAAARRAPLAIVGGGTRAGLGRRVRARATLSTKGLSGVTLYEPAELVLSARAGTPLAEIEALLAEKSQRLAFEPMDHRPLFGESGEPTIGGVVAANVSGPRRIQAGAARDSLIGVRAVTGEGEIVKSGGRVMKNVTGYDLVKFLAGSYGTLAILTEVSFKLSPTPETETTLVLTDLDDETAIAALSTALGSPFSVTGAAHRPAFGREPARTFIRLEGFAASVADRAKRLSADLTDFGQAEQVAGRASPSLWQTIRDVALLGTAPKVPIWRVSTKPSLAPALVEAVRHSFDCRVLYDWGGGLVWIAGGEGNVAGAGVIRGALGKRGHATLIRASAEVRDTIEVFQPLAPPLYTLTRKLKQTFDPAGILNPGRIYAGL